MSQCEKVVAIFNMPAILEVYALFLALSNTSVTATSCVVPMPKSINSELTNERPSSSNTAGLVTWDSY